MSHATTIRKYFGYREGQKAGDFIKELNALTPEDKEQLAAGIENGSLDY